MAKPEAYRMHCARVFSDFYSHVKETSGLSQEVIEKELRLSSMSSDYEGRKIRRYLTGENIPKGEDFLSIKNLARKKGWWRPGFLRELTSHIPTFESWRAEINRQMLIDMRDEQGFFELSAYDSLDWDVEHADRLEERALLLLRRGAEIRKNIKLAKNAIYTKE